MAPVTIYPVADMSSLFWYVSHLGRRLQQQRSVDAFVEATLLLPPVAFVYE